MTKAQGLLVQRLQDQQRFGESIAILEPLVQLHPDMMHYRAQLMLAYFRTRQPDQLTDLVRSTDAHFHEEGRWDEGNIAEFAATCRDCELYDRAVGYMNEAIALHQRANGGITLNDQWLSDQYQILADAQAALGHTKEAVDAASSGLCAGVIVPTNAVKPWGSSEMYWNVPKISPPTSRSSTRRLPKPGRMAPF